MAFLFPRQNPLFRPAFLDPWNSVWETSSRPGCRCLILGMGQATLVRCGLEPVPFPVPCPAPLPIPSSIPLNSLHPKKELSCEKNVSLLKLTIEVYWCFYNGFLCILLLLLLFLCNILLCYKILLRTSKSNPKLNQLLKGILGNLKHSLNKA